MQAAYRTPWNYAEAYCFRYDGEFMTDPNELRQPLTDLLQAIEARDPQQASAQVRQIVGNLDDPARAPGAAPEGGRPPAVKFGGLIHALLRDLRSVEKHIDAGNWDSAAKVLREAIQLLPEPHTFRTGRTARQ